MVNSILDYSLLHVERVAKLTSVFLFLKLVSIHSASSERSSLASNSPEQSPLQAAQVATAFSLNASSPSFTLPALQATQQHTMKLHQPSASRARNPIPIVNPGSRPGSHMSMATTVPSSVSPSMRLPQQAVGTVW